MAQQTAVEWLQIQLKNGVDFNPLDPLSYPKAVDNLFEKAKQMEKKQLKEMYLNGIENYDPTFKRKSQWTEVDNMTRRLK